MEQQITQTWKILAKELQGIEASTRKVHFHHAKMLGMVLEVG